MLKKALLKKALLKKALKFGLYADLSNVSAFTINSMRQAFQLQKFYERLARGGSRYTEIIRSFFSVS